MEDVTKAIQERRAKMKSNLASQFEPSPHEQYLRKKKAEEAKPKQDDTVIKAIEQVLMGEDDLLVKGRALPVGTIKKRGPNSFIKTASGWKYHGRANEKQSSSSSEDKSMTRIQMVEKLNYLQQTRDDFYNRGFDDQGKKVQKDIDKLGKKMKESEGE
jgi:hypothetical protein